MTGNQATNFEALPLLLTVSEAARLLRISRGCAYEAVRRSELPHVRIGKTIRIPRHGLEALLAETTPDGKADGAE